MIWLARSRTSRAPVQPCLTVRRWKPFTWRDRTSVRTMVRAARIRGDGFVRQMSASIAAGRRPRRATSGLLRCLRSGPGANAYIETLVRDGVVVSIGHTNATGPQIQDAVSAGATLSTHLGNGAHRELVRHPNYIWEQMADDRLAASLIVDGIHLGPAFLKVGAAGKRRGTHCANYRRSDARRMRARTLHVGRSRSGTSP